MNGIVRLALLSLLVVGCDDEQPQEAATQPHATKPAQEDSRGDRAEPDAKPDTPAQKPAGLAPTPVGPLADVAAPAGDREKSVLAILAGGPAVTALPEAATDEGQEFKPHLVETLAPRPQRPRVRIRIPTVVGEMNKNYARRVALARANNLRTCYERGLRGHADLAGEVTIELTVSGKGKVTTAKVATSTLASASLPKSKAPAIVEKCMAANLMRLKFPASTDGKSATISYPLILIHGPGF